MTDSGSSSEGKNTRGALTRSTLVAMTGIIAFVVIAYLAWDLLRPAVAPCDSILEQTSVQLQTKLELLGAGTELKLGRSQVQALTEKAQVAAVNLKGCCIVMSMSKLDSKEFLQCKSAIGDFEDRAHDLETQVEATAAAKEAGDEAAFKRAVQQLDEVLTKEATESKRVSDNVPPGELRLQAVLSEIGENAPVEACFDIYHAAQDIDGNRVKVDRRCGKTTRISLKPGRYYVYSWYGNAAKSKKLDIVSNETTNAMLDYDVGTLRMQTALTAGADPLEACFDVYHAKQDIDGKRVKVDRQCKKTARFYLAAGDYFVNTWHGNASTSREFAVKPGELTNPLLELKAGILRLQTVLAEGSDPLEACFDVYHAKQDIDGKRVKVDRQCKKTARFYLAAGDYFVNTWHGNASMSRKFTVISGELTNPTLVLDAGLLRMQTVLAPGTNPLEACFDVHHAAQDIDGKRVKVDRQCKTTARFYLTAGKYFVNTWYGNANTSRELTVTSGGITNPVLDLQAGTLRLQSALDADSNPVEACFDVYHAVQDIDGKRVKIDQKCTTTARFYLAAGRYFVYTWLGDKHTSDELEVRAGELENHRFLLAMNQ